MGTRVNVKFWRDYWDKAGHWVLHIIMLLLDMVGYHLNLYIHHLNNKRKTYTLGPARMGNNYQPSWCRDSMVVFCFMAQKVMQPRHRGQAGFRWPLLLQLDQDWNVLNNVVSHFKIVQGPLLLHVITKLKMANKIKVDLIININSIKIDLDFTTP